MGRSKRGIPPTETAFPHQRLTFSHQEYPLKLTQIKYHLCHLAFGGAIYRFRCPKPVHPLHT